MFAFLNTPNSIKNSTKEITNLPGLFSCDIDKIKLKLLNYTHTMRDNLRNGSPIFRNISEVAAKIEYNDIESIISGRLPVPTPCIEYVGEPWKGAARASAYQCGKPNPFDSHSKHENAALAFIMTKELMFMNHNIRMLSLIVRRYQEEPEEIGYPENEGGSLTGSDTPEPDLDSDSDSDSESHIEYPLVRSSDSYEPYRCSRKCVVTTTGVFAVESLRKKVNNLCRLIELSPTYMTETYSERLGSLVLSDIFIYFSKFDADHRNPVVWAFLELQNLSLACMKLMELFASNNLFRLTKGTEFATLQDPHDAIFTQRRDST